MQGLRILVHTVLRAYSVFFQRSFHPQNTKARELVDMLWIPLIVEECVRWHIIFGQPMY